MLQRLTDLWPNMLRQGGEQGSDEEEALAGFREGRSLLAEDTIAFAAVDSSNASSSVPSAVRIEVLNPLLGSNETVTLMEDSQEVWVNLTLRDARSSAAPGERLGLRLLAFVAAHLAQHYG